MVSQYQIILSRTFFVQNSVQYVPGFSSHTARSLVCFCLILSWLYKSEAYTSPENDLNNNWPNEIPTGLTKMIFQDSSIYKLLFVCKVPDLSWGAISNTGTTAAESGSGDTDSTDFFFFFFILPSVALLSAAGQHTSYVAKPVSPNPKIQFYLGLLMRNMHLPCAKYVFFGKIYTFNDFDPKQSGGARGIILQTRSRRSHQLGKHYIHKMQT